MYPVLSPDDQRFVARHEVGDSRWCLRVHGVNSSQVFFELWTDHEEGGTLIEEPVFDHDGRRLYSFLWDTRFSKLKLRIWGTV